MSILILRICLSHCLYVCTHVYMCIIFISISASTFVPTKVRRKNIIRKSIEWQISYCQVFLSSKSHLSCEYMTIISRIVCNTLTFSPSLMQDVRIVQYGMTELAQSRVLAGARASLLHQGVTGLHSAPCLRALLQALPTLLQEQYQYEKPLVLSGEQLLHSGHLKCLAALVLVLRLDRVLCYQPVPPNHEEHFSVGKLHDW